MPSSDRSNGVRSRLRPGPAILFLIAALGIPGAAQAQEHVRVKARPVALGVRGDALGRLRYRGALVLTSRFRHFGGLSSLRWVDGRLLAISDEGGHAFSLRPVERGGRLVGIGIASTARLGGPDGAPLAGKAETDAEAMEVNRDAAGRPVSVSIAFERHDRVWTYELRHGLPFGTPRPLEGAEPWLARQPENLGVEAMAGDDRIRLMVSEGLRTPQGDASALLFRSAGADPVEIGIPAFGDQRPSELAMLDPEHFLMLRWSWSAERGFRVELDELTLDGPTWGSEVVAAFAPPTVTDNYEGAAIRRERGRTFLYLVSDDNFDAAQRTLLLKFELVGRAPADGKKDE